MLVVFVTLPSVDEDDAIEILLAVRLLLFHVADA
jgi:hypothetical protein